DFETAIRLEAEREGTLPDRLRFARPFSYLSRGLYADLLRPYVERFPRHHLLVLRFEDIIDDPASLAATLHQFLGLPPRPADAHALREFAACTESPPTTARLPVSYRRVPGTLRAAAASLIGRLRRRQVDRWARFPRWPLDLSADFLSDVARERCAVPPPTPVVLTHDIDSAEGL